MKIKRTVDDSDVQVGRLFEPHWQCAITPITCIVFSRSSELTFAS